MTNIIAIGSARLLCAVLLITLLAPSTAAAADGDDSDEPHVKLSSARLRAADDLKSPGVAAGLSIVSTVVPMLLGGGLLVVQPFAGLALFSLGLGIGPSLGHFYAGEPGHAVITGLLRLGVATGGALLILGGLLSGIDGDSSSTSPEGLFAGGTVLLVAAVGLAIYDMVDAPRAAHRTNASRRTALSFAPVVAQTRDRTTGKEGTLYGLAMSGQF
jgi:hypothetical protein